jgi:hypothetical protein
VDFILSDAVEEYKRTTVRRTVNKYCILYMLSFGVLWGI